MSNVGAVAIDPSGLNRDVLGEESEAACRHRGYVLSMPCKRPPELRFFVGGVGGEATEPQLRAAFAEVGVAFTHVELIVNRATGVKRGFAFVYVYSPPIGPATKPDDVLERMRGVTVNGHPSTVSLVPAPIATPIP